MTAKRRKNSHVGLAVPAQGTVLESDKGSYQQFSTFQCVQPARKFGQVLFLYRVSNFSAGNRQAESDDSGTIAVIAEKEP